MWQHRRSVDVEAGEIIADQCTVQVLWNDPERSMTRVDPRDQELTCLGAVLSGGSNRAPRNFATQRETLGAKVYWDDTNKRTTTVATDNTLIGAAVEAVASGAGDTIGRVRLNATF